MRHVAGLDPACSDNLSYSIANTFLIAILVPRGNSEFRFKNENKTSMRSAVIFIVGLIACAVTGAQVGIFLFARPDKRYPLRPRTVRDTVAVVGCASILAVLWICASMFWLAPNPN